MGVRHGVAPTRWAAAPNLDSRSQENRPNQMAASGRARRAPVAAVDLSSDPCCENRSGSPRPDHLVRDGVVPSA